MKSSRARRGDGLALRFACPPPCRSKIPSFCGPFLRFARLCSEPERVSKRERDGQAKLNLCSLAFVTACQEGLSLARPQTEWEGSFFWTS